MDLTRHPSYGLRGDGQLAALHPGGNQEVMSSRHSPTGSHTGNGPSPAVQSMRGCRATCRVLVCCVAIGAMVVPARAGAEPHRCTFAHRTPGGLKLRPVHGGQWSVDSHIPTLYGGLYTAVTGSQGTGMTLRQIPSLPRVLELQGQSGVACIAACSLILCTSL